MRSIFGAVRFLFHPRGPTVANLPLLFLCLGSCLLAQEPAPATQKFVISGVVKSGTTPIPGATVIATDSAGQKTVTSTDLDGSYGVQVLAPGRYTLRAEMSAFAPVTRDVVVAGTSTQADLGLVLLSRVQQPGHPEQRPAARNGGGRGFQSLAVMQGEMGDTSSSNANDQIVPAGMPMPGVDPNAATESIAVSGNNTSMTMSAMSGDEMQQRM
ncbi:MAG TPA: carboxypeptidase-like regulatory domain-containing protein, partial [Terriglobales bacterium]|nr:carboxypeptidase-like regulatory domain-containing protein [Terriglobales bacterium]